MIRRLNSAAFCAVAMSLNDLFYATFQIYMSHNFIAFLFACAIFCLRLVGCIRSKAAFVGSCVLSDAL